MSFVSFEFLIFVAIFFAAWPFVRKHRSLRLIVITVASFLFYGWHDWRFLILLIFTGGVDFFAAIAIERWPAWRRMFIWTSLTMNIGCLFFFKYLGFAGDQLRAMLDLPPEQWSWTHSIVLPIGISFYTFQSMSYTIDVYRGRLRAIRDVFHFFAYLAMFPQLVAGPIVRAVDLLPQLEHEGNYNKINRWNGLQLMALGFFKKLVVADNIAPLVNAAFGAPTESLGGATWWVVAFAFGGQIYCDFSGYSDIACGLALWLGYSFNANFRHPYAAVGFQDFWARWHISLSTWFRDYVYIPLGGSRRKPLRNAANLWLTMLMSGLWHGANWTFVIWGFLHSGFLTCEKLLAPRLFRSSPGTLRVFVWLLTLACVTVAWVAFRANSTEQLFQIWQAMCLSIRDGAGFAKLITPSATLGLACLIVVEALSVAMNLLRRSDRSSAWFPRPSIAGSIVVLFMFFCSIFLRGPGSDFIYFAF
jgi:alginate O-acetyltransferase complex protein AlgI